MKKTTRSRQIQLRGFAGVLLLTGGFLAGMAEAGIQMRSGKELYQNACAACHGIDGRGAASTQVGFEEALPDFTDCRFVSREPDADWMAVAHGGGPARGFAKMMPAFGEALSVDQLQQIVTYVRTFCTEDSWPRGELNLPRPLVTEKAYPEDEAVFILAVNTEGQGSVTHEIVYEKRIGAKNQLEVLIPFEWSEQVPDTGDWRGGVGDVALGFKRVLAHSLRTGSILSLSGEVKLPTGDRDKGLGAGATTFEPFLTYGQILPSDSFLQLQGGFEFPFTGDETDNEVFLGAALGRSFTRGRWGRTWTPMVEFFATRDLHSQAMTDWDVIPQVQVSLNKRQHLMVNLGLRLPLTDTATRETRLMIYLLWDWFDGGLLSGW